MGPLGFNYEMGIFGLIIFIIWVVFTNYPSEDEEEGREKEEWKPTPDHLKKEEEVDQEELEGSDMCVGDVIFDSNYIGREHLAVEDEEDEEVDQEDEEEVEEEEVEEEDIVFGLYNRHTFFRGESYVCNRVLDEEDEEDEVDQEELERQQQAEYNLYSDKCLELQQQAENNLVELAIHEQELEIQQKKKNYR